MTTEPTPIRRRDALASGYTDAELRTLYVRDGWTRLRAGYYVPPTIAHKLDQAARHRELVRALIPALNSGSVVSHQSALVLYGIPVWDAPLDRVHVTRDCVGGGYRTRQLHVHCAPLDGVAHLDGMPVTPPARAVVDFARTAGFESAVVAGDAALRRSDCDAEDLTEAARYVQGRPGYRAAQRAIAFADGRSESVGESRSRVVLASLPLPTPQLQTSFLDDDGLLIGRSDFCFVESGVIGEFDGKVKYGKYLRSGEQPGDAVYREKVREDKLRELGWEVVRWCWSDLERPVELGRRLERAVARGRGRSRSGRLLRTD